MMNRRAAMAAFQETIDQSEANNLGVAARDYADMAETAAQNREWWLASMCYNYAAAECLEPRDSDSYTREAGRCSGLALTAELLERH